MNYFRLICFCTFACLASFSSSASIQLLNASLEEAAAYFSNLTGNSYIIDFETDTVHYTHYSYNKIYTFYCIAALLCIATATSSYSKAAACITASYRTVSYYRLPSTTMNE